MARSIPPVDPSEIPPGWSEDDYYCWLAGEQGFRGRWHDKVLQDTVPHAANCATDTFPRAQMRRWVIPRDPRTAAQVSQRRRYTDAIIYYSRINHHDAQLTARRYKELGAVFYHRYMRYFLNGSYYADTRHPSVKLKEIFTPPRFPSDMLP